MATFLYKADLRNGSGFNEVRTTDDMEFAVKLVLESSEAHPSTVKMMGKLIEALHENKCLTDDQLQNILGHGVWELKKPRDV